MLKDARRRNILSADEIESRAGVEHPFQRGSGCSVKIEVATACGVRNINHMRLARHRRWKGSSAVLHGRLCFVADEHKAAVGKTEEGDKAREAERRGET
jgi:hypothetical protein